MTKLIQIDGLSYRPESLPPHRQDILQGISLEIEPGALVAVVGENGSGKTTLLKQINGLLMPTAGKVLVDGLDTRDPHNHRALRTRVGMVFQNPADQIVASTVAEDVAFGLENANLPTREVQRRVAAQLQAAGLSQDADRPPHLLSGGQLQKVALAGVLARQPKVLLFDEPTSMLDPAARQDFLERIRVLNRQGLTILFITHHMEEAALADQVIVLKAGAVILNGPPREIFGQQVKLYESGLEIPESMALAARFRSLGWNLSDSILSPEELLAALPPFPGGTAHARRNAPSSMPMDRETWVQTQDVHYTYLAGTPLARPALQGATLSAARGQIHALAGTNGSGKSTLLQHLNGILRPASGTVRVGNLNLEDPETRLRTVVQAVGLVFQNPETQFFEVFVGDEIAYGPRQFELADLRERVRKAMAQVGLDFEAFKDRRLETLSGGEKRKVALASTLVLDQDVFLFDEPTAGMDPQARNDLLALFQKLQEAGKTILIASHRLDEMAEVADDLSLMQSGRVQRTGPSRAVLSDQQAIAAAGLIAPLTVVVTDALISKGWPLAAFDTTTPEKLISALRQVAP